ncbi:MAG: HEPN domain-containing protein [Candidatus Aenigmarchaeota archaeon]|nr:HEPN domain-containing protein [Candidatus Aenigmarchaeota archaeon]
MDGRKIVSLNQKLDECMMRRGLRKSFPSDSDAKGHINKAKHDLVVMTDLKRLKHSDWVIVAAYYSMYQACLSILSKLGVKSKDHTCTANLIQYLFVIDGKVKKELLRKFNKMEEIKRGVEEGRLVVKRMFINSLWNLRRKREAASYGIKTSFENRVTIDPKTLETISKILMINRGARL